MNLVQSLTRRSTTLVLAGVLAAALGAVAIPAQADDGALEHDLAAFMDGMGGGHRGHMMGRHGGAGGPGHGMHGRGMHGRGMERLLELVNASADQRSRIQSIMAAAHKDITAQREAARPLHDQMRTLLTQPTIDARVAESLRAQMAAQREVVGKRMLQARLDVANTLTAEQRRVVAERMVQMRTMMERHRSERQQLERR